MKKLVRYDPMESKFEKILFFLKICFILTKKLTMTNQNYIELVYEQFILVTLLNIIVNEDVGIFPTIIFNVSEPSNEGFKWGNNKAGVSERLISQ